ncbi:MAG: hypothetical protein GY925_06240, partial [Actinomycetia bacterium]|nr:hypothetical protein [Actinomycetes bacterium]
MDARSGPTRRLWTRAVAAIALSVAALLGVTAGAAWLGTRSVGFVEVPTEEYEAAFAACRDAIIERGGNAVVAGSAVVTVDGRNATLEASAGVTRSLCKISWGEGFTAI